MKILIISVNSEAARNAISAVNKVNKGVVMDINKMDNFNHMSTIWAFNFGYWLSMISGVDLSWFNYSSSVDQYKSLGNFDFCIVLVNRGIKSFPNKDIFPILKSKIKHKVMTICVNSAVRGPEDGLIHILGKRHNGSIKTTWGAMSPLLKSEKPNKITILVDHIYYGNQKSRIYKTDKTREILDSLVAYNKRLGDDKKIVIKQIGSGRVVEIKEGYKIDKFKQSRAMSYQKICKHYNESHIFVVTHNECFGLSVIEAASAGALIVTPSGYIKRDVINKLHHHVIPSTQQISEMNWDEIISKIDPNKSSQMANKSYSYKIACNDIYRHFHKIIKQSNKIN